MRDKRHDGGHSVADSQYRTLVSGAVLKLQEKGVLEELKAKWWKAPGGMSCSEVCEPLYRRRHMTLSIQVLTSDTVLQQVLTRGTLYIASTDR